MVVAKLPRSPYQGGSIMLTHRTQLLNRDFSETVEWNVLEIREQLGSLEQWIAKSAEQGASAHEVERGLFDRLLQIGTTLFGAFLKLVGPGDLGETATLD